METQLQNKSAMATENISPTSSGWNLVFLVTTFTIIFSFLIVLLFPSQSNLMLSLRTAVATMFIGLGLIYTFKIKDLGLTVDYRALFFISLLFISYGFVFGNIAVWGVSSLFLIVSLINVSNWKNEQKWSELSFDVRKVKLIMIIAIVLLFFISIVLLYCDNKIENYKTKARDNLNALINY